MMIPHNVRILISMMVHRTIKLTRKYGKLILILLIALMFAVNVFLLSPTLIHRERTRLIINNRHLCSSKSPALVRSSSRLRASIENDQRTLLIVIPSARYHFKQRNLVRQTYGAIRNLNNIKILAIVFMMGGMDAPENEQVDSRVLEAESNKFGDIIMGDFVDTYRNLTRKTIMAYEWVTSFCQEAQFVIKTDDDTVLNIFKITEELNALPLTEVTSSTFRCPLHYNETVHKNINSKFYASPVDFPFGIFPTHCTGNFYVTTMTVINRLAEEISRSFLGRVCTHEDVFMTAIVPEKINSWMNFGWIKNKPITHINKRKEWESYALQNQKGDDAEYLMELLRQPINGTDNFDEFLERFGTKCYFLLAHNDEFEERYTRLWQVIVITFENKSK